MHTVNKKNLSYIFSKNTSVVITGDSLAYNRYDFIKESRMNAWDCYLGMKSWSFMLRDYIISHNKNFKFANELEFEGKGFKRGTLPSKVPFQNKAVSFDITDDNAFLNIKEYNSNYLYFITAPIKGNSANIDDTEVDLRGNKKYFLGYEIKCVKSQSGIIHCPNSQSKIIVIGCADTAINPQLTGSGSKTAKWLYDNRHERLLKYNPDLCFIIIGANDRRKSNPEEFYKSLCSVIDELNKNKKCDIVLLTSPHSSTSDIPPNKDWVYKPDENITLPIIEKTYIIQKKYDTVLINLFEFFKGVPVYKWRYDNVHLTKTGNMMLYEEIVNCFFKGVD